ncbi:hypothetical protein EVAR_30384_1 [Eumeta japonica]|uniref:Uncharacterized protein n=1 Tax=Eumeta variegata TaxID=151549 RepID=A0A4C1W7Y5_EUMVA|nr:hypothetical protein EVAR_30384_1 [Eumeta japonica]
MVVFDDGRSAAPLRVIPNDGDIGTDSARTSRPRPLHANGRVARRNHIGVPSPNFPRRRPFEIPQGEASRGRAPAARARGVASPDPRAARAPERRKFLRRPKLPKFTGLGELRPRQALNANRDLRPCGGGGPRHAPRRMAEGHFPS